MTAEEKQVSVRDIVSVAGVGLAVAAILWQGGQLTERVQRNTTILISLQADVAALKREMVVVQSQQSLYMQDDRAFNLRLEKLENTMVEHLTTDYRRFKSLGVDSK